MTDTENFDDCDNLDDEIEADMLFSDNDALDVEHCTEFFKTSLSEGDTASGPIINLNNVNFIVSKNPLFSDSPTIRCMPQVNCISLSNFTSSSGFDKFLNNVQTCNYTSSNILSHCSPAVTLPLSNVFTFACPISLPACQPPVPVNYYSGTPSLAHTPAYT